MRVLVIHNFYASKSVGGEDIVFRTEVNALSDELGEENVFHYSVSNDHASFFALLLFIWWSPIHYFRVKRLITRHSIDIVHIHNFFPILTPSIFFAAKKAGAKVVHTLHNFRWWCVAGTFFRNDTNSICEICSSGGGSVLHGIKNKCFRNSYSQSLMAVMAFSFYRLFSPFRAIDLFIALTPFQRQKLLELGVPSEKIALKPNSIGKVSTFTNATKEYDFIYIGRIEPCKGVDLLLEALEDNCTFKVRVIGEGVDGPLMSRLKSCPQVIYTSRLDRLQILEEIAKSKFLLHLSKCYETFGLTIIEAFSQGVPVIGYPIGTRLDFIRDGENGLLVADRLSETLNRAVSIANYSALASEAFKSSLPYVGHAIENLTSIYQDLQTGRS